MDRHDALVQRIYDAALNPAAWALLPEEVTRNFGATSVFLADGRIDDQSSFTINSFGFDDTLLTKNGFKPEDHFDPNVNPAFQAALGAPLARGFDGHLRYANATELQDLFYRKCFIDNNIPLVRAFLLQREERHVAGGFMAYGQDFDPLQGENRRRFDTVLSHVKRSVEIRTRLQIADRTATSLGRRLDGLKLGVFVIDPSKRVVYHNAVAEDLVRRGQGVVLRHGYFSSLDEKSQRQFSQRLSLLYNSQEAHVESPIPILRADGAPPLQAWVYPAVGFGGTDIHNAAFACILVRDPDAASDLPDLNDLIEGFDLTRAEARVARLTPLALPIEQMAQRLGLSRNTVKTHLANTRGKLGVRSTAELAQTVTRLKL